MIQIEMRCQLCNCWHKARSTRPSVSRAAMPGQSPTGVGPWQHDEPTTSAVGVVAVPRPHNPPFSGQRGVWRLLSSSSPQVVVVVMAAAKPPYGVLLCLTPRRRKVAQGWACHPGVAANGCYREGALLDGVDVEIRPGGSALES